MHTAITIDALKVLDAIDRKGSFAGAAGELFRVPSAISYTVQKLEEDLDVEIFDRSGHRATLTPAGRYLLNEGRALLEATEALAHTTRQVAQGWETRLRIGFSSLLPEDALFPTIRETPMDVTISVAGVSCRQQVEHFTHRRSKHIAEVLAERIASHHTWKPVPESETAAAD